MTIGYGDRTWVQSEMVSTKLPTPQSTIRKIEKHFRQQGYVRLFTKQN